MSFVAGTLFLRETKDVDIVTTSAAARMSGRHWCGSQTGPHNGDVSVMPKMACLR
jgi:hypothetical protein